MTPPSGPGLLLAELVPLALAILASPFAVVPAIFLLFGTRPRASAAGFLGGWVAGVAGVAGAALLLAEAIDRGDETPAWAAWARIVLGAALVLLAVRQWRSASPDAPVPGWMATLEEASPGQAARLGVVLSAANPKVALLAVAAGVSIASAGLPAVGAGVAMLGFVALASVSVATPLLLHLVVGPRILGPLGTARGWLIRHQATVVAAVLALLGIALVSEGLYLLG
jgi:threonine/homoserine/homoserine lactone efflux protein